jgi:hypothetical protein
VITCQRNELVKDVINRYLLKTQQKKEDLLFLFNTYKIGENLRTVNEQGLINDSIII